MGPAINITSGSCLGVPWCTKVIKRAVSSLKTAHPMALLTVRELQDRLASLAAKYGDEFPLAALAAEARGDGRDVKVAILGG